MGPPHYFLWRQPGHDRDMTPANRSLKAMELGIRGACPELTSRDCRVAGTSAIVGVKDGRDWTTPCAN